MDILSAEDESILCLETSGTDSPLTWCYLTTHSYATPTVRLMRKGLLVNCGLLEMCNCVHKLSNVT
jgi:hypothetical protein